MSDKIKSRFILWDTGTDGNNGRVVPAHFTPTKYVPAQVASEGADKISAHLKGVDSFLTNVTPQNIVWVKKNPNPGEFSSIKAAVDSITTASASNPFIVRVGPGVYIEDTITLKSYVAVEGQADGTTIIEVDDPTKTAVIGVNNSELRRVGVRGSTGVGATLIYFQGTSTSGGFSVVDCALGSAYRLVHVEGDGFPTVFRSEGTRILQGADFTQGFLIDRTGTGLTQALISGLVYQRFTAPYPDKFVVVKNGARAILDRTLAEVSGGSAVGIEGSNGAHIDAAGVRFEGFETGLHILNVGSGSRVEAASFEIRGGTNHLLIEHPGTTGNFQGVADFSKNTIDPSADFAVAHANLGPDRGMVFSGELTIGRSHEHLTPALDLIQSGPTMGVLEGGALSDGGGFQVNVSAGFGYFASLPFPNHRLHRHEWSATSITLGANQDVYIYFNTSGILTASAGFPTTQAVILLGRVVTDGSGILFTEKTPLDVYHWGNKLDRALRFGFGPIYDSGSIVSENATPLKLDITAGDYYFAANRIQPTGGTAITFTPVYRDGSGGYTFATPTDAIDSANWDDGSGTLAPLTTSYYTKHTLWIAGAGATQRYYLVYGQAEYSAEASAVAGADPTPPASFKDAVVHVASVVIQEGATSIGAILDTRPTLAFRSGALASVSNHGNLAGLAADDHPQYLLVDGSRAMSGALDMGGNPITNVGLVDGVDVSAHASRHLPAGADPLATAAAVGVLPNNVNGVGTANSFSRADHTHALPSAAAITQAPDQANAAGTANTVARSDHVHNIPTAAAVGLNASSTNTQGSAGTFARSDHTHAIATGAASTQTPDQANAAGSSANLARADHVHNIATDVAVDIGTANAQGVSTSFARADHVHQGVHGVRANTDSYRYGDLTLQQGSGVTVTDNGFGTFTIETVGAANELRVTHVSALDVAWTAGKVRINGTHYSVLAGTLTLSPSVADGRIYVDVTGTVAATTTSSVPANAVVLASYTTDGSAVTALADLRVFLNNNVVFGTTSTQVQAGVAAGAGALNTFSRADHVHNIATAAAAGQAPDQTSAEGVSSSLARADHVHNIPTAAAVGLNASSTNTQGSAGTFARSDHTHAIPSAAAVNVAPDNTNGAGTSTSFSRADHTHALPSGVAVALAPGAASSAGTANTVSRSDHVHQVPTAAPAANLTATTTNAEGTGSSFSRNDHSHAITTAAPVALAPDAGNAAGTAAGLARADHVHNVPTAAPITIVPLGTNAQGVAATFARADHGHAIATAAPVTSLSATTTNAAGTANSFSRSDHVHSILTGVVVAIGTANAAGTSANLARADHVHDHGSQTVGTHHAAATQSVNGFMSSTDKTKLDRIGVGFMQYSSDGTQTTSSATFANISFDNDQNSFANSLFTKTDANTIRADFDGIARVAYKARITSGAAARGADFRITLNGSAVTGSIASAVAPGNTTSRGATAFHEIFIPVAAGDLIRIQWASPDAATITLAANDGLFVVEAYRVT